MSKPDADAIAPIAQAAALTLSAVSALSIGPRSAGLSEEPGILLAAS